MNQLHTSATPLEPANNTLLQVTQLRKEFGGQPVLAIDEFSIATGEVVLLVGNNGAGKSTLLRILAGLEPFEAGTLWLHGKPLARAAQRHLRGQVIYLHQHPYLFDTRVRDNIEYGLRCAGLPKAERQARIDQALEWSGLTHLGDRHAKTLSGGEKQRIALARAWVLKPSLLLLDEPTANMDPEAREQTYFLVRRLVNEGMAVLMTSHSLKADHPMLSRILRLKQGRLQQGPMLRTPPIELEPEPGEGDMWRSQY